MAFIAELAKKHRVVIYTSLVQTPADAAIVGKWLHDNGCTAWHSVIVKCDKKDYDVLLDACAVTCRPAECLAGHHVAYNDAILEVDEILRKEADQ